VHSLAEPGPSAITAMTAAAPAPWGLAGEPHLVFQLAADLAIGRLLGFEALLPWNDGSGGHYLPARRSSPGRKLTGWCRT